MLVYMSCGHYCFLIFKVNCSLAICLIQMPLPPPPQIRSNKLIMSAAEANYSETEASHEGSMSPLHYLPLLRPQPPAAPFSLIKAAMGAVRCLFPSIQSLFGLPSCQWPLAPFAPALSPSRSRVVAGTFFGHRRGRVSFAVQADPRSEPALLLDLSVLTCDLVKEMASGTVRILLECDRAADEGGTRKKKKIATSLLWDEPVWSMHCNGRRHGYAVARRCTGFDLHVLGMVRAVSVGAGVLPPAPLPLPSPAQLQESDDYYYTVHDPEMRRVGSCKKDGAAEEVMYMRARFERVVGSKDSEAFYLINPDSERRRGRSDINAGPELCIFLLRM